ncbi:hypothetical protein [Pontibacter cellulosilyticus]|uniref:STAS/SEC14 domain-containing protein n=1 Tax=Pontibacter cellulosilyticus TaxID=1720253 RepID=A0A923N3A1_9BACT|nr:hypothetical protein [Pontibacter cellulosilyticus]MBC5991678.1 hypothetical protein [Pontibacter cellulosilyticus]
MITKGVNFKGRVLYTTDFLTVSLEIDEEYLYADWSGVIDAARAKAGCNAILDCLRNHSNAKILNNNSKVTGHYPGAIDWVGNVWFPEMYKLGVRWFAWVYSPEFYTQLGTDQIISLSSQVTIETFYDIDSALQWLVNKTS